MVLLPSVKEAGVPNFDKEIQRIYPDISYQKSNVQCYKTHECTETCAYPNA